MRIGIALGGGGAKGIAHIGVLRVLESAQIQIRLVCAAENQAVARVASRAVGIMTKQMRQQKMQQSPPDFILYPNVEDMGLMDFDLADECLAAGEQAARAALPQIDQVIRAPRWRYQSQKLIERIRSQFAAWSA